MLPWKNLIQIQWRASKAVYLQIAEGVICAIRSGQLGPGQRLPGSRQMAGQLDVNRKTAILAYDELLAQGWIVSRASRGTFVAENLPVVRSTPWDPAMLSGGSRPAIHWQIPGYLTPPLTFSGALAFDDGLPDIRLAPIDELARAYSRNLRRLWDERRLGYADALGHPSLRQALAQELHRTRGLNIGPDHVMITRGSQMAIFLAARITLAGPRPAVAMGKPGYRTAELNFRYAGAEIIPIPVDEQGIDVFRLEEVCRSRRIDLVYVTPHHHHPTTVVLPPERRLYLLQLAERYEFAILEDDYDYDFHYANSPVLPLASGDRQRRVLYIGSLSKSISPAIRVGYLVGSPEVVGELPRIRRLIDRQGDVAMEAAIADLLYEGIIRRYLKKALKQYRRRRDLVVSLLRQQLNTCVDFEVPAGGLAVWARFHPQIHLPALSQRLQRQGVYLSDGSFYAPEENAVRMGFAGMNESEATRAVTILRQTIQAAFPTFALD